MRANLKLLLIVMTITLSGCATLSPDFEDPQVKVVSLRMLPAESQAQGVAIGLRILNPNSTGLNLVGMSYSLRLQGHDLLSGARNDIPPIPAYSEVPVEVVATFNLINGLRFLQTMINQQDDIMNYELVAKLDIGSRLMPAVRITESGQIKLNNGQKPRP